jgi:inward rectifier potassium channel
MKPRLRRLWTNFRTPLGQKTLRIINREGRFELEGLGRWYHHWRDPYHLMLTLPWPGFAALICGGYLLLNTGFALLYLLGGDCLNGATAGSFGDAFFFSVQTFASIGYGAITPKTPYANLIVTAEAIASLLTMAMVTGLAFSRFSKPTARVMFSNAAVITRHNGIPTLILRAANQRRNQILEAQIKLYLSRDETTLEGHGIRRVYDLKLVRNVNPTFVLSWSVMHPIHDDSPLYGLSRDDWAAARATIVVTLSGLDETVADTIYARRTYGLPEILWNHRFQDVIETTTDGERIINYRHFHTTIAQDIEPPSGTGIQ